MHTIDPPTAVTPLPASTATGTDTLYPRQSIIGDLVRLVGENTDLPLSGAVFVAYARISAALAQAGFTLRIDGDGAESPNLQLAVLLADDADPGYLVCSLVDRVLDTSALCSIPAGLTSASLFAHASKNALPVGAASVLSAEAPDAGTPKDLRCLSVLTLLDGEDWLKALHVEQPLGKLHRQIHAACHGQPLHTWTKKEGDCYTAPVHLSILLACRQSPFFAAVTGLFFNSGFVQQFLVVLGDDRPATRKPIYGTAGIGRLANAWTSTWREIVAGPREYEPAPAAETEYRRWWLDRLTSRRTAETELRKTGRAAWKYALVIQTLLQPNGEIGIDAIRIALAIADRHLTDRRVAEEKLAWETTDERLARKVANYITDNPEASRGKLMTRIRGASDPAALNRALARIMELHASTPLALRAAELHAVTRSRGA